MSAPPTRSEVRVRSELPIGPRLEAVLALAYRARRSTLLEGPTGIGKSEVVAAVAKQLDVAFSVLDLSLLEPPDLVGLPIIEAGRTRYALPSALPSAGAGILMLEELNRAERYIQAPALQLLTARRLHEYSLPEGWVVFAAINPQVGDYQVTPLDAALRARFLHLSVRVDRAAWIAWAIDHDVHPTVVALARAHDGIFAEVPPRTWSFVSQLLAKLTAPEIADGALMRDALAGYLPLPWVELVVQSIDGPQASIDVDVRAILERYAPGCPEQSIVRGYRDRGQTDRIDAIVQRLAATLAGPEAGVLIARRQLTLSALETFLADLPGDQREKLQSALAANATAIALLDITPAEVLTNYVGSRAHKQVSSWRTEPLRHHRIALLVTALRLHIQQPARVAELKKSNVMRASIGQFLQHIGERWGMPLVDTLQKINVTPIRPGS